MWEAWKFKVRDAAIRLQKAEQRLRSWLRSAPESEWGWLRSALGYIESNLVMGPISIFGSLLSLFLPWTLYVVGGMFVLAFHRLGIVRGRSRLLQGFSYVVLSVMISITAHVINKTVARKLADSNNAFARLVVSYMPNQGGPAKEKGGPEATQLPSSNVPQAPKHVVDIRPARAEKPAPALNSKSKDDPRCSDTNGATYLFCSDERVGQWAIEESEIVQRLVKKYDHTTQGSYDQRTFFFNKAFQDCCSAKLKGLHAEVLRRLGPSGSDPDEINDWNMLFMSDKYPILPKQIEIGQAGRYAPRLRKLGLTLKRREEPREPVDHLTFVESLSDSGEAVYSPGTSRYQDVVTVKTKSEKLSGYIVLIFDRQYAACSTNFVTSEYLIGDVGNESLRTLLTQNPTTNYVLRIAANPFVPEAPITIYARGPEQVRVKEALWYDE